MPEERYSNAQRLAFAALVIGFLMSTGAGIAPYWRSGDVKINTIASLIEESIPFIGDVKLAKFEGGLIWYCVEIPLADSKSCEAYDFSKGNATEKIPIFAFALSSLLSLLCVCGACCRMCCCGGGKTICHGIMAFLAGGFGIVTIVFFMQSSEDSWEMKLNLVSYDWAFYVYIAGIAVTTLASFVLCCAYPQSPIVQVVSQRLPSTVIVTSTHGYGRLQDDMHPLSVQQSPQTGAGVLA